MTTALSAARIELSKQLADYWASAATSAGAAGGTTIVDTALKAKSNDWIDAGGNPYDLITSGTYDTEERKISSLDNSSGTLTVLAHTSQIASAVTYEIHRLFTASDKRIALIAACRKAFPYIFKRIRDESHVSGNWLKDGSFEVWTTTTDLTYWTETTSTVTQTSTAGFFKHGNYSAKLTTLAGNLAQNISNNEELKRLAGKSVTFTVQGKCDTASCLRIGIYDGTTTTYSDYLDQITGWTENSDPLEVTATIQDNPSQVSFYIYHDVAAATSYVDDARVIGGGNPGIYVGELGLQSRGPHQVFLEPTNYYKGEPWILLHGCSYDAGNSLLLLPDSCSADLRLRINGIGFLDFLVSGVSSTAWTATVDIDQPQLDILIAFAARYLYETMALPNFSTGDRKSFQEMISFWDARIGEAITRAAMQSPPATINWGM